MMSEKQINNTKLQCVLLMIKFMHSYIMLFEIIKKSLGANVSKFF